MADPDSKYFDAETLTLLRKVLDEAWEALPEARKRALLKTELAARILAAAGLGERDPERLKAYGLRHVVSPPVAGTAELPN